MRLSEITEGLDSNQRRAGQVGAEERASKVSPVLGKEDKQHPYKGRLVGENETVDEASLATMRDYFAGNKDAEDELTITKQRKYYQELRKREEEELRKKAALQGGAVTKIGGNIKEVAPPGMEDWIKDRKADFKKRYGDRWQEVLYATAWKQKKNEGVAEANDEKIADRYDQDEWDEKMQRLKKLAGQGPLKTVWDPDKRVYKDVPVNQKPEDK